MCELASLDTFPVQNRQNVLARLSLNVIQTQHRKGPSIKYVTLFLMIFDPPSPCHKLSQILDPLKVCHNSEQKVNMQISRMETALNN